MITLNIKTKARTELIDITGEIQSAVKKSGVKEGVVCLHVPHTTAAVTINENADPDVRTDILTHLNKMIPFDDNYRHTEGNAAAHIKSTLVGCSHWLIIENAQIVLGAWQGIFFCEFDGPRSRKVHVKIINQ